jgi:ATPase subunit of ABC transporter with duplicated ATPase domains
MHIKPSSRVNPYIFFEQKNKLFENILEVKGLSKRCEEPLFNDVELMLEMDRSIAII